MSSDPGTQKWTATSVHVSRDVLGVTAGGVVNIDGPVFEIGTSALTTATASGRLYPLQGSRQLRRRLWVRRYRWSWLGRRESPLLQPLLRDSPPPEDRLSIQPRLRNRPCVPE
jgi:hypothetical protein